MTYKGEEIAIPSLAMFEEYVAERNMFCRPKDAFLYWLNRKWCNIKGEEVASVERMADGYNLLVVNRAIKVNAKELGYTKLKKREKKKEKRAIRRELLCGNKKLEDLIKKPIEKINVVKEKEYMPYEKQLEDDRWKAFRKFVFAVRGKKCEVCGGVKMLQVHHPKYVYGRLAWEYNCNEVMVVCKNCHERIHNLK